MVYVILKLLYPENVFILAHNKKEHYYGACLVSMLFYLVYCMVFFPSTLPQYTAPYPQKHINKRLVFHVHVQAFSFFPLFFWRGNKF